MRPVGPCTVWCGWISPSHFSKPCEEALGRASGRRARRSLGSPIDGALDRGRRSSAGTRRTRRRARSRRPSDVQRWPAVPKPENSAPSAARSRSASGITTSGFLPPSSRQGVCRCRPQSAPIWAPTSEEPVKPTFCTSPSVERAGQPVEGRRAVGVDGVEHARGHAAGDEQLGQRVAEGGGVLRRLPHHGVAAEQRRDEVPGRHRHREVAGRDDAGDPDRDAEGEQLLVAHLRRARSGRRAGGPRRGRSRRCRRSPAPRRGPRRAACRPRGRPGAARASALASTSRPTCAMTRPRTGAGVAAQAGCASRAARNASTSWSAEASETSATTSSSGRGLVEVNGAGGAGRRPCRRRGGTVRSRARGQPVAGRGRGRRRRPRARPRSRSGRGGSGCCGCRSRAAGRCSSSRSASSTASRSAVSGRENAHIRPRPRTSVTCGCRSARPCSSSQQVLAGGRGAGDQAVGLDDLEDPPGAHHVDEGAAPGGVDAARTSRRRCPAPRRPGRRPSRRRPGSSCRTRRRPGCTPELLVGPGRPGQAAAGLHLVEHEQRVVLVAQRLHRLQELRAGSGGRRPRPGSARR